MAPRPQSVAGGRPYSVTIRLSAEEKRRLDGLRGGLSPSDFFRALLNANHNLDSESGK
jgi:hypothetical protein